MTLNGQQVTRVSYRPEFSMGPLGVAFDLELFITSDGHFMSTGWKFNNQDQTLNSLYRKIYYVRWNHPGDGFYARVGALENITMDAAGLITSGYGNVANYPGQKLVGTDIQFNNWFDPWNVDLEAVNNSLQDWNHGGGVAGAKLSFTPFGFLPVPILKNMRIGGTVMRDFNQYATVPDGDNDHCPDAVDGINGPGCLGSTQAVALNNQLDSARGTTLTAAHVDSLQSWLHSDNGDSAKVVKQYSTSTEFTEAGIDYQLPLITSDILTWGLYGEAARPFVSGADSVGLNKSWGLVPVGTGVKVWKLDMGLEYRMVKGRFQVGNFDAAYEMNRVRFLDGQYLTKTEAVWDAAPDNGISKGYFGRVGMDVWGILQLNGTYSELWGDNNFTDKGYSGKVGVGKTVLGFVPKISVVEAFYSKEHVHQDGDSFFGPSIYTTYGYRVGLNLAGGMTVIVGDYTTYSRDTNNKLVPQSNFVAETVVNF